MNAIATVPPAENPRPSTPVQRAEIAVDAIAWEANQRQLLKQYVNAEMTEGIDYGVIPGTGKQGEVPKKSLLKPGAEKLVKLFHCNARFTLTKDVEDWDKGFFYYRFQCQIVTESGFPVAEGIGSANSREPRYRWRDQNRACPQCKREFIKRSKFPPKDSPGQEPGWYCFAKLGGCGAQFDSDDPEITEQSIGRIENPDIADAVNTLQKMAKKRALVDAALTLARCSDVFTQDLEDDTAQATKPAAVKPPSSVPSSIDPLPRLIADARLRLEAAGDLQSLGTIWASLGNLIQQSLLDVKESRKAALTPPAGGGATNPTQPSASTAASPQSTQTSPAPQSVQTPTSPVSSGTSPVVHPAGREILTSLKIAMSKLNVRWADVDQDLLTCDLTPGSGIKFSIGLDKDVDYSIEELTVEQAATFLATLKRVAAAAARAKKAESAAS
jgi:hypothetical protein